MSDDFDEYAVGYHDLYPCGWRSPHRRDHKWVGSVTGSHFCRFVRFLAIGDRGSSLVALSFNARGRTTRELRRSAPFGTPEAPFQHEIIATQAYTICGTNHGDDAELFTPLIVNQYNTNILEAFYKETHSVFEPNGVGDWWPDDFVVVVDGEVVMGCVNHEETLWVRASLAHLVEEARPSRPPPRRRFREGGAG